VVQGKDGRANTFEDETLNGLYTVADDDCQVRNCMYAVQNYFTFATPIVHLHLYLRGNFCFAQGLKLRWKRQIVAKRDWGNRDPTVTFVTIFLH
jgi:hypothetical protein